MPIITRRPSTTLSTAATASHVPTPPPVTPTKAPAAPAHSRRPHRPPGAGPAAWPVVRGAGAGSGAPAAPAPPRFTPLLLSTAPPPTNTSTLPLHAALQF